MDLYVDCVGGRYYSWANTDRAKTVFHEEVADKFRLTAEEKDIMKVPPIAAAPARIIACGRHGSHAPRWRASDGTCGLLCARIGLQRVPYSERTPAASKIDGMAYHRTTPALSSSPIGAASGDAACAWPHPGYLADGDGVRVSSPLPARPRCA